MTATSSFQVDLQGMISLLGRHLYSRPQVYVRELLQNGIDAITARARLSGQRDPSWRVRLGGADQRGDPVWCVDDGIGMTLTEVREVLATVGKSSKRDRFDLPTSDYLGQFGIGLLSCFMVTDRVVVRTRSATGTPAVEWVGYSSGVFTATEIPDDLPVGTTVEFIPRPDEFANTSARALRESARLFGEYLDVPVEASGETINSRPVWALGATRLRREPASPLVKPSQLSGVEERSDEHSELDHESRAALREFGEGLVGGRPLATIPLTVPGTDLRGAAFVLPYPPSPNARQSHRVYLGGMLVTDSCDNLLPDWAFFVRGIVTTTAANPTASREQLVDDEALSQLRHGLGAAIRQWIERTGRERPDVLADFVAVHHLGLRSVAIHDPALAAIIVPWLPFETSAGRMLLRDFVARWPVVRYVAKHEEYEAIAPLASANAPILDAGYVYDKDIVQQLATIIPGVECVEVTATTILDSLTAPPLSAQTSAARLERCATEALTSVGCEVVARVFEPSDCTAFLVADPDVWRRLEGDRARAIGGLWSSMLDAMAASAVRQGSLDEPGPASRLCLNWSAPMIQKLAFIEDNVVATRILRVVYCQAVLAAHRPLALAERTLLGGSLDDLLDLSLMDGEA